MRRSAVSISLLSLFLNRFLIMFIMLNPPSTAALLSSKESNLITYSASSLKICCPASFFNLQTQPQNFMMSISSKDAPDSLTQMVFSVTDPRAIHWLSRIDISISEAKKQINGTKVLEAIIILELRMCFVDYFTAGLFTEEI